MGAIKAGMQGLPVGKPLYPSSCAIKVKVSIEDTDFRLCPAPFDPFPKEQRTEYDSRTGKVPIDCPINIYIYHIYTFP